MEWNEKAAVTRYRLFLFSLLGACYIVVYFHRSAVGVVAVEMMDDLGVGAALMGLLSAGYFYSYALMQIPTGILADTWGPRRSVSLFFFFAAAGSMVFGLSSSSAGVLFGRVLVGVGVSTFYVCALKLLRHWYCGKEFTTMCSLLISIGGIGLFVASVPMAVVSDAYGWRVPFVAAGLVSFALAAAVFAFVHDSPEQRIGAKESTYLHVPVTSRIQQIFKVRAFWPAAIWLACMLSVYIAFGGLWAGPYLMHTYGLSKVDASGMLLMISVGMIVASPLIGVFSDRVVRCRKPLQIVASMFLLVVLSLFMVRVDSFSVFGLYAMMLAFGVASIGFLPIGNASILSLFPKEMAGTAAGIANTIPFIVGALLQPLMGRILELSGTGDVFSPGAYQLSFIPLIVCAAVALACSFFIKEMPP